MIDRDMVNRIFNLGRFFFNNRMRIAKQLFWISYLLDKKNGVDAVIFLVNIYRSKKKNDKAIKLIKKIENYETNYNLQIQLAYCYDDIGMEKKGLEIFESLLNNHLLLGLDIDFAFMSDILYFYNKLGDYKKALNLILTHIDNKVCEDEFMPDLLFFNIGNTYSNLNNDNKALYYYNKALRANPNDINILNNIAFTYRSLKKYEDATYHFQIILKKANKETEKAKALYGLGCVQDDLGNKEAAINLFKNAALLGHETAKKVLSESAL